MHPGIRKARSHRRAQTVVEPETIASDAERAAGLVKRSREILKPLANLATTNSGYKTAQQCNKDGGPEVVGALIRMAKIDLSDDSRLSAAAFARFQSEGEMVMDSLQNVTLNWTILLALFLTINVSLMVMHSGGETYGGGAATHAAFEASDKTNAAWQTDFASFAYPGDDRAKASLRRGLYVGECVSIGLGIFFTASGLINALAAYSVFGAAFPDISSKVEFALDNPTSMFYLWGSFDGALISIFVTLSCVAARASALMGLVMLSIFGAFFLFMMMSGFGGGIVGRLQVGQAHEARRVLSYLESPVARQMSMQHEHNEAVDHPEQVQAF